MRCDFAYLTQFVNLDFSVLICKYIRYYSDDLNKPNSNSNSISNKILVLC